MLTLSPEAQRIAERSRRIVAAIKAASVGPMPIEEAEELAQLSMGYGTSWALSFLWSDDGHITPIAVVYNRSGHAIRVAPVTDKLVQLGEKLGGQQMELWKKLKELGKVDVEGCRNGE